MLYKRGKVWWIRIKWQGKLIRRSAETNSKELARRIEAKVLTELAEGKWFEIDEAKRRTFEELRERYMREHSAIHKSKSSNERDAYSFKRLSRSFGGMALSEIKPARISEYKSLRQSEGVKTATVSKELELLRNAFNIAVSEWEWMEHNPFMKVKIEKAKNQVERWLTPEEEQRLLDASPVWLREIIIFALNTGMRRGEILTLKWTQVDLLRRSTTLLVTKNKEKRTIPLNQTVLELLRGKSKVRHISGFLFVSEVGTMIQARNLLRAFYSARKQAGLEDVRFHDLRHSFATRLVQSGVDLYVVKELLGHKTLTMTMRYAHHYPESLRHGVEVLDKGAQKGAQSIKFNSLERHNPLISLVGDEGFEPTTPAV